MTDASMKEVGRVLEDTRQISNLTLEKRFERGLIEDGIKFQNDVLPFLRIQNQILPVSETPDRGKHNSSWTFTYLREAQILAYVSLKDSFSLPLSQSAEKNLNNKLMDELRLVPDGVEKVKNLPSMLTDLSNRVKELDGWNLSSIYSLDLMDGWNYFAIDLEKSFGDTKASVRLDLTYGCSLEVKIPVGHNFDETTKEVRLVAKVMSNWLKLPYSPNLEYEFSMKEGVVEDDPSRTTSTFPEYFFKVLDYWKSFSGSKDLRALVGRSNDNSKPILILEDPSLSVSSGRSGVDFGYILYTGSSSYSGLIVSSHPDVYEAFRHGIQDRRVNQNLTDLFPNENFDDRKWLHMFVHLDPENGATFVEDQASNGGKEELKKLFDSIEKQYGISYGGAINKSKAEREARRPMFMPKINDESAIIKEKYDSSTARKFRGYAVSALIDGNKHAFEKYESYLKLL
ncbi:MAG: hypothetical protein Q8Q30_03450 [Candidatus Woesebacteria bacterium]|nr:hypothetical protein [Candidatus Woesebacteria bacterium]